MLAHTKITKAGRPLKKSFQRHFARSMGRLTCDQRPKDQARFVTTLRAMIATRSLNLSDMAAYLSNSDTDTTKWWVAHNLIRRGLGSPRFNATQVRERFLDEVVRVCGRGGIKTVVIDGGEIVKPYGFTQEERNQRGIRKGIENLAIVRDGSASTRQEPVLLPGWHLAQVVGLAHGPGGLAPVSLYTSGYTEHVPGFKSQNDEMIRAMRISRRAVAPDAMWIADREFDADWFFDEAEDMGIDLAVRMNTEGSRGRRVFLDDGRSVLVGDLYRKLWWLLHEQREQGVPPDQHGRRTVAVTIRLGGLKGGRRHLRPVERPYVLLVTWNEKFSSPVAIISTRIPKNYGEQQEIIDTFFRRHFVEDHFRFAKEGKGKGLELEGVRVHRWRAVAREIFYVAMAAGYLALLGIERADRLRPFLARWRSKRRAPRLFLYRLIVILAKWLPRRWGDNK